MPNDDGSLPVSRRSVLAGAAGLAGMAAASADRADIGGNLYGGTMALNEAYNVAGELWIGPDSAKSEVDANAGRVYMASDSQVEYYGDGSSWNAMGVGSQQSPVPEVHSELTNTDDAVTNSHALTDRTGPETVDENGIWYYHNDKTVVRDPDRDVTYISYLGGSTTGDGYSLMLAAYDHEAESFSKQTLRSGFSWDDHTPASVELLSDGRVGVAYTDHGNTVGIAYRFTDASGDISTLGSEQTISPSSRHDYPYLVEQDGDLYIWFRENTGPHSYVRSVDGGTTWSSTITAVEPNSYPRIYAKKQMDDQGRLHMTFNDTGSNVNPHWDVYHGYFKNRAFYAADGTQIATESEFPLNVYDAFGPPLYNTSENVDSPTGGGEDTFSWDIAVDDESGDIAIVHSEFYENNEHVYRYIRYDAEADEWDGRELCHAGTTMAADQDILFYSHSATFDPQDPDKLYVSIGDREASKIQRWETDDKGETWTYEDVTDNVGKNSRPRVPQNAHPEMELLWCRGEYFNFVNHEMSLVYTSADTVRAEQNTPPIATPQSGGSTLEGNASNATDVPGDNTWTRVGMTNTAHNWLRNQKVSGDEMEIQYGGLYYIVGNVQFQEIDTAGTYEARIIDAEYDDPILTLGAKSAEAGDKPKFGGSRMFTIPEYSTYPPKTIQMEVRQDSGSTQTTEGTDAHTNLTLYQIG